jgi:hypothetical protein
VTQLSLSSSLPPAAIRRLSTWQQRVVARYRADHRDKSNALPSQEATLANEWPDPNYWTAYDHLAIEREAQALRRAYAYALIARGWRRLKRAISLRT